MYKTDEISSFNEKAYRSRRTSFLICSVCYSVVLIIMLLPQRAGCQDRIFGGARHKTGFQCGYGDQDWNLGCIDLSIDVNYTYEVYFFQFQYYYSLLMRSGWGIDFLLQPQFNIVNLKTENESPYKKDAFEYGLNGGFIVRFNFWSDRISVYGLIGSGPHYVSNTPSRQAKGFIFSDNINFGINYRIDNNIYLDLRPGFRHISNAGIQSPNAGVNTHTLTTGILIVL